jgi:glycosyltransferase involved in cell wall biosynthesis
MPERPYTALLDVRHNLARLAPLMDERCIRLFLLDTAHILFHNAAEAQRLLMLQQRRSATLRPRRHELPNMGIEYADYATTTGNEFTIRTFAYANKPIFRLPIPADVNRPWPDMKDWDACRHRFLVFTSGGFVHKGLDLVLEAFAGMSEYQLTICAPLDDDKDFCRTYERELYRTPNIRTVGWVDVRSSQFFQIADSCTAVVHLSCSEGGGASVINCMHTGLIPIVTYESSVDVHEFGVLVKSCALEEIQEAIHMVAALPAGQLKERSRRAWEHVTTHHTKERFSEAYRRIASTVLASSKVTS